MKTTESKLNVRLLRRIQKHILEEPQRLYMYWFSRRGKPGEEFLSDNRTTQKLPACGTAACIAGWANLLTGGKEPSDWQRAERKLGLEISTPVFDVPWWPEPFKSRYGSRKTAKGRANVAAARIEHLISKGE